MMLQQLTRRPLRSASGSQRVAGAADVRSTRQITRHRATRARIARNDKVEALVDEDPSPFFEPLLRSFVLGLGTGALCESAHVLFKVAGLTAQVGGLQLFEHLPHMADSFAPLFVWDHVAAVGSWALLYIIEAVAILSVLNRYPNDAKAAAVDIQSLPTLSKKMLPLKLKPLKTIFYGMLKKSQLSRPALAASSAAAAAVDRTQSATNDLSKAAADAFSAAASVLDRPRTTTQPPPVVPGIVNIPGILRDPTWDLMAPPTMPPPTIPVSPRAEPESALQPTKPRPKRNTDPLKRQGLKPGAMDPDSPLVNKRSKDLMDRKSYLKNFWYAAALSEKVGKEPVGVDILGSRVVLFRDNTGRVQCLDDACPHRGAPLSDGWVTEIEGHSCVVCPYHGWAFDKEGTLKDVPSVAERGQWPKRPLMNSYPVEEKGGFVWLFYGSDSLPEEERPPIPFTPELEDPKWRAVYGEIEFDCGHWSVFENAIDMAHIHYLHGDSFGNQDKPVIHDMEVSRDTFQISASFEIHNKPVSKLWEFTAVESVPVTAQAFLPSSSSIQIQLGAGVSMITFVNTVPISENRAINRFALIRNFAGWDGFDFWARNAMFKILGEDKVMVEKLRTDRLPFEVSLLPDAPQIAFRKLRQEYVDMGYAVAPESVQPRRGLMPDL